MSIEFVELGDRLLQSAQVSRNAPFLDDLRDTMRRFLDLVRSTDRLTDDQEDNSLYQETIQQYESSGSSQPPWKTALSSPILDGHKKSIQSETSPSIVAELPGFFTQPQDLIGPASLDLIQRGTTGGFGPVLSYGLLSRSHPDLDKVPMVFDMDYCIGGLNSFATRLFFNSIDITWKSLSGQIQLPGFLASSCRYRFRYDRPDTLRMLCYRKLTQMRSEGFKISTEALDAHHLDDMETVINAFTPEEYAILRHSIIGCVSELLQDGFLPQDWMDSWNTYQYISMKWDLKLTSSSVLVPPHTLQTFSASQLGNTPLEPTAKSSGPRENTMTSSFHSEMSSQTQEVQDTTASTSLMYGAMRPDVIVDARRLLQRLTVGMVCLGDGPRFSKPQIDAAIQFFLAEVSGKPVGF